jgi:hypothetical protein
MTGILSSVRPSLIVRLHSRLYPRVPLMPIGQFFEVVLASSR